MASYPFGYHIAQVVGFSGAMWLSGNIAALSMIDVPALVRSQQEDQVPPDVIVKQWRNIYEAGKSQNPPIAATTATAFLYLAWSVRSGAPVFRHAVYNRAGLYSTAAILTLSIMPYTILVMNTTNNALLRLAKSSTDLSGHDKEEGTGLLNKWVFLNGFRSLLPLAGGLIGMTAAFI